jgi:4-hydroxybenzoate polyprenyltransferase
MSAPPISGSSPASPLSGPTTTPATPAANAGGSSDATASASPSSVHPIVVFGRMVKFSHTVFAMPFALAAVAIAARDVGLVWWRLAAIVVAMAGARTAAMGFNRIVDRAIDARNPRTAGRELPRGLVSVRAAWTMTVVATAVFIAAAAALGPLCLALTPVALAFLFGYSLTKRFTALCHLVLGLAIAGGPGGAWIAIRGDFGWAPGLLMLAVATWIGGFDILYALSDREFDRGAGLHSIPVRLGVTGSLVVSALLHLATVGALAALASVAHLGGVYLLGVGVVAALLVWEHWLVRPNDLSRLGLAFFNLNGYVSVAFLIATVIDVLI